MLKKSTHLHTTNIFIFEVRGEYIKLIFPNQHIPKPNSVFQFWAMCIGRGKGWGSTQAKKEETEKKVREEGGKNEKLAVQFTKNRAENLFLFFTGQNSLGVTDRQIALI